MRQKESRSPTMVRLQSRRQANGSAEGDTASEVSGGAARADRGADRGSEAHGQQRRKRDTMHEPHAAQRGRGERGRTRGRPVTCSPLKREPDGIEAEVAVGREGRRAMQTNCARPAEVIRKDREQAINLKRQRRQHSGRRLAATGQQAEPGGLGSRREAVQDSGGARFGEASHLGPIVSMPGD